MAKHFVKKYDFLFAFLGKKPIFAAFINDKLMMKSLLWFLAFLPSQDASAPEAAKLLSAGSLPQAEAALNGEYHELVFSDEFDQPDGSRPDTAKWVCCKRYNAGWNRWISPSPDVAFIEDGHLVCRAIPNYDLEADTAQMLTGAIETRGKFAFQYGRVEVRMRTNLRQGNFPAAWMVPDYNGEDKRYGEIDIVEMFGTENMSAHTVHTHRTYTLKKGGIKNDRRHKVAVDEWHVYGVTWTKDRITWTVDGREVLNYDKIDTPQMKEEGQWTFDRPFYIRLNQSVGTGNYEVLIPHTDEVYETQFDWIRVYSDESAP